MRTTINEDENIRELYPDDTLRQPYECVKRAYLVPVNAAIDAVNKDILGRLDSPPKKDYSFDFIKEGSNQPLALNRELLDDYLAIFSVPGVPNHELELKEGCMYTIQRNLSIEKSLVKNAKVVVLKLNRYSIQIAVLRENEQPVMNRDVFPKQKVVGVSAIEKIRFITGTGKCYKIILGV